MTLTDSQITTLLAQARGGDERAFGTLVEGVRERVIRWALVITRDSDDAEDVAQRVAITLHRRLGDFQEKSRFTTWLYTIVRNASIESLRKSRRYTGIEDETTAQPWHHEMEERLTHMHNERAAGIVRSYFTELPARQRELIELVDRDGRSAAEAAEMMGIEPETARVHLLRARRALRTKMLESHPEMFQ